MADSSVLVRNKRYEAVAAVLWQLATALFGACAVKGYVDGDVGFEVTLWFLIAAILMYAAWSLLGLLETED